MELYLIVMFILVDLNIMIPCSWQNYEFRSGIAYLNYGIIENCYYNWLNPELYNNSINTSVLYQYGDTSDVVFFVRSNGKWQMSDPVVICNVEINNLIEALNEWILIQQDTDEFPNWCEDENIISQGFPFYVV